MARERCYGPAQLAEFLQKLITCYRCVCSCSEIFLVFYSCFRCFSALNCKQKENGLVFKEFETCSLQLQIPVADLLENFKQLLGDAANTAKMLDKEVKEKMAWVQNEALLPFSKYCMWCLAMKRELVASSPQNLEAEFVFLDHQRSFLNIGCTCTQCQSADVAQLASGCWSCIRNSRRDNKDIVLSFNLLEQQAAVGAPVEFTFSCLSGAAYSAHHETDRLFLLLPTQPLELRDLLSKISANPAFDARISIVRHWLVSHNVTPDQLTTLVHAGGSRRWKAELLLVAANRLTCPVSGLSKCLSSIIASLPGCFVVLVCYCSYSHLPLSDVEASHALREIGPLSCLNHDAPILNFDLDLRLRDERCALICVLRMCTLGKLSLKEFIYTSRVQLKREEFGHMVPWGDSLTGIRCSLKNEWEWKATCAELSVDPDVFKVTSHHLPDASPCHPFAQWNNHEHAPKQGRAQVLLQAMPS